MLACAEVAGSEDNEVNELNFMSAITRNQAKKEQVHDAMQNELPFAADFSDEEKEGKEATHTEGIVSQQAAESKPATLDTTEMLESVHNSRQGHWGAYRTWVRLRDSHPGNGIPFRVVQDFVQACPICQKVNRPMMDNKLESRYRTIKSLLFRKAIGIDHVTITPVSKDGYKGITVIVNMFSGEADLYPYKVSTGEHDARSMDIHGKKPLCAMASMGPVGTHGTDAHPWGKGDILLYTLYALAQECLCCCGTTLELDLLTSIPAQDAARILKHALLINYQKHDPNHYSIENFVAFLFINAQRLYF